MYTCFNLSVENGGLTELFENDESRRDYYYQKGAQLFERDKTEVEGILDKYVVENDILDGKMIEDDWFPAVEADIFLSHSHRDEEFVIALSGWLYEECDVKAFVDSGVWGYSDILLKKLDDEYCWNSRSQMYNYTKRNVTTSHVHMMLNNALAKMMDKTECLFFINTGNSTTRDERFEECYTYSPWLYSEIGLSQIIQRKSKEAHREKFLLEHASEGYKNVYNLQILHPLSLDHMKTISCDNLLNWARKLSDEKQQYPLDSLYKLMEIKERVCK
ncbi:MAG: hypothetical protein IJA90_11350 [Peptococcaceae bacterium]|nr:hypothetical protein [Peptococcaceae bacterium]